MKDLERYKAALEDIDRHMKGHWSHEYVATTVAFALRPPPEMETVEVVRHLCLSCNEVWSELQPDCCGEIVRLTGSHQRPKLQPVEMSAAGHVCGRSGMVPTVDIVIPQQVDGCPANVPVPPMGASVTLTWLEPPK